MDTEGRQTYLAVALEGRWNGSQWNIPLAFWGREIVRGERIATVEGKETLLKLSQLDGTQDKDWTKK